VAAATAAFLVGALMRFGVAPLLAALAVILAFTHPLLVSQHLFVIATHPSYGMFFFAIGLVCLAYAMIMSGRLGTGLMFAVAMFAMLASVTTSVTFWIAPFSALVLLAHPVLRGHPVKMGLIALIGVIGGSFPLIRRMVDPSANYHYEAIGRVDYSVPHVLQSAITLIKIFGQTSFEQKTLVILFIVVSVFLGLFWFAKISRPEMTRLFDGSLADRSGQRARMVTGLAMLAASALTAGPIMTLSYYADRYFVGPAIFGIIAAVILVGTLLAGMRFVTGVVVAVCVALWVAWSLVTPDRVETKYARLFAMQDRLRQALASLPAPVPADGQVLIVVEVMPPSFALGFRQRNTWYARSTGYLRSVLSRTDIDGLPGLSLDHRARSACLDSASNPRHRARGKP
jgi:hypothetical protein